MYSFKYKNNPTKFNLQKSFTKKIVSFTKKIMPFTKNACFLKSNFYSFKVELT